VSTPRQKGHNFYEADNYLGRIMNSNILRQIWSFINMSLTAIVEGD